MTDISSNGYVPRQIIFGSAALGVEQSREKIALGRVSDEMIRERIPNFDAIRESSYWRHLPPISWRDQKNTFHIVFTFFLEHEGEKSNIHSTWSLDLDDLKNREMLKELGYDVEGGKND